MQKKWLLISIEIVDRELNGKSLLIVEALKRNYNCIIGTRKAFFRNFRVLPKGVFICKSASRIDEIYIEYAKRCGNKVVCLDEEGFVESSLKHLLKYRLNNNTIKLLDKYFLWGDNQTKAFKKYYSKYNNKFVNSGNPRVDLWTNNYKNFYKKKLIEIKKNYGDYILIPTSFSPANHYYGEDERLKMFSNIYKLEQKTIIKEKKYIDFVKILLNEMIDLIKSILKKFPNKKILIKVHPSENKLIWKKLEKDFRQIIVCENFTVSELIKGASLVIQSESTTAVESYLSKVPVISYIPSQLKNKKKKLLKIPQMVSKIINNKEDVFKIINKLKENTPLIKNEYFINKELSKWLLNLRSDEKKSYEKIIDTIDDININFNNKKKLSFLYIVNYKIKNFFLDIMSVLEMLIPLEINYYNNLKKDIKIRELGYGTVKSRQINFFELLLGKFPVLKMKIFKHLNSQLIKRK